MKYLLYLDATLAALGGVMSIAVGFVVLVFWLNADASPEIHAGLPGVVAITGCFAIVFLLAGAATVGVRRARSWHWWLQALLVVALPLLWTVVQGNLRSP